MITATPEVLGHILAFMAAHHNVDAVAEARANRRRLAKVAPDAPPPQQVPTGTQPDVRVPPTAVRVLVSTWRMNGCAPQPGIAWDRAMWLAAFRACADELAALPDTLDRATIRAAARQQWTASSGP